MAGPSSPFPAVRAPLGALLIGAASALAPALAYGQESTGGLVPVGTVQLDTVQVEGNQERGDGPVQGYVARQTFSGTKTDTPIARTPQSVSVVTREQMDDQEVESVAEALRYTPGVFSEYRGASNLRDEVFVRGFYYVPRYLDGLLLGGDQDYAKINPYLLERVELLAGPSSVLYGQLNPGGIINMVSKKPLDTPLREIELTVGNNNFFQGSFDFSDRINGSDKLAFRVAGTGLTSDLQEEFAEQQAFAIAPSLRWTPDDQTTLTILAGYQNEPDAGYRNFLDAAGTLWPIRGYGFVPRDFFVSDPTFEKAEREQAWIGYEFEREVSEALLLRQKARYYQVDWEHNTLIWGWTDPSAPTVVHRTASGGPETWGTFTIDNQAQFKLATGPAQHTLLAGLDFRNRTRDYKWGYNWSAPTIDLRLPIYGGYNYQNLLLNPQEQDVQQVNAMQTGVYLQDQIEIGNLNLLAGIRYDWAQTAIDDYVFAYDSTAGRNAWSAGLYDYNDEAMTWRVGALYTFANGIAPYASYSTSFEPALYAPPIGGAPFTPTTAEQYEIGVKYAPEGTRTLLTAAYYDIRQKGVVEGEWTPVGTVYKQIGEIHNRGIELSARTELNDNISVIASYSYVDSTVTDSVTASEVGMTPARIPANQASFWGKYSFTEGQLNGLSLAGGIRYIGTSWGDDGNTFEVPAYTLFDAMLKYDLGAVDSRLAGAVLQVNAKNIGDLTYVASCASAYACFYGEGRSVAASFRYTW